MCNNIHDKNNIYNAIDEDDEDNNINPPTIANSCNGNAKLAHHLKRPTEPSWQIDMRQKLILYFFFHFFCTDSIKIK